MWEGKVAYRRSPSPENVIIKVMHCMKLDMQLDFGMSTPE